MTPGPVLYAEPARTYTGLLVTAALLVAGFGADVALSGVHVALTHLAGWLVFGGLVVGAQALFVYAARSTKSLTLTATEIRVGDQRLLRTDVAALATRAATTDLPVLGWPHGRPKYLGWLTVRRTNGCDVLIPTRHPDRLAAALGLRPGTAPTATVRPAQDADLAQLPEIDARADVVFRMAGYELPAIEFDDRPARAVFVADAADAAAGEAPVGFVQVDEVDGLAHVRAIAVLPGAMRHGLGSQLLERACSWAAAQGYPAITLTTYRDVPWNAPFYARRGFVEPTGLTPGLASARAQERELGLDAVGPRVVLRRDLSPSRSAG